MSFPLAERGKGTVLHNREKWFLSWFVKISGHGHGAKLPENLANMTLLGQKTRYAMVRHLMR